MRIIFMGTPEFAVPSLKAIHDSENEVAAVVTAPDKPAGRGRKLRFSPVKEFAVQNDIEVLQPQKLRNEEFLKKLSSYQADIFVVVAFRMLPKEVWQMPEKGTINLHASLLPQYRGAAPINWAIINGEKLTGLTTFYINEKIDTGDLLLQEEIEIADDDILEDVYNKMMHKGSSLLLKTLHQINDGQVQSRPQKFEGELKAAPKLNKENTRIDFNKTVKEVNNLIRGLSPFPGAYTYLHQNGEEILFKIYRARPLELSADYPAGYIITTGKSNLQIYCKNGVIEVLEAQLPGKKRMKTTDLLNGFSIENEAWMG